MGNIKNNGFANSCKWQLVLISWGEKYSNDDINRLVKAVCHFSPQLTRISLITDRVQPDLLDCVEQIQFPSQFLTRLFCKSGCQAKLAMFQSGILKHDLPAIYLDLDTAIFGDIGVLFPMRKTEKSILILQSAIVPFSAFGRMLWRFTRGKKYARGNSSVIAFHPKHCEFIAQRFLDLYKKENRLHPRPLIADERFISWVAQPNMIAIPNSIAVKFTTEFMLPNKLLSKIKSATPWAKKRRDNLILITFCDEKVKPENLVSLPEGAVITDRKSRVLIWNDAVIGKMRRKIIDYYSS